MLSMVLLAIALCTLPESRAIRQEKEYSPSRPTPCYICGTKDLVVRNEAALILASTTGGVLTRNMTCSELQEKAWSGQINPPSCILLSSRVWSDCGCEEADKPLTILGIESEKFLAIGALAAGVGAFLVLVAVGVTLSSSNTRRPSIRKDDKQVKESKGSSVDASKHHLYALYKIERHLKDTARNSRTDKTSEIAVQCTLYY